MAKQRSARESRIQRGKMDQAPPDSRDVDLSDVNAAVTGRKLPSLTPPAETVSADLQIDLTRPVNPAEVMTLEQQIRAIKIVDADSHARMLQLVKVGKMLFRKADDHWRAITRRIDAMKADIMTLAAKDRDPLKRLIAAAEEACHEYTRAEERRVEEAAAAERRRVELEAQQKRDQELADAEAAALEAEASSEGLSPRELWFVNKVVEGGLVIDDKHSTPDKLVMRSLMAIAKQAGYKEPVDGQVARLLRSQKVLDAIDGQRSAKALREQASAVKQQPLQVETMKPVVSQVAKVAGVQSRKYYRAEVPFPETLLAAFMRGEIPIQTFIVDQSFLDKQATALKGDFESAFPGCRLIVTDRLAG